MAGNKTEQLSAAEARALFQKEKKPLKVKPEKKVKGAKEEMDIGDSPDRAAMICITINGKAQYAEYREDYIEFEHAGRTWRIKPEEVKPINN